MPDNDMSQFARPFNADDFNDTPKEMWGYNEITNKIFGPLDMSDPWNKWLFTSSWHLTPCYTKEQAEELIKHK